MQEKKSRNFWLGNILLAISLIMLLFMGSLWEQLGSWAMAVWMILAGVGFYFVTTEKGPSDLPD